MIAKNVFDILNSCDFKGYNKETFKGDIRHILVRRGYHTQDVMIVIIVNNNEVFNEKSFKEALDKILKLYEDENFSMCNF